MKSDLTRMVPDLRIRRAAIIAPVLALPFLIFLQRRLAFLAGAPFLSGADSYYYAMQVRSLVETGVLKIPDFSPLFDLMALTVRMGFSYEQAVIFWGVFSQALFAGGVLLARRLFGGGVRSNRPLIPLLAWALLSPTAAFTAVEFPKYALALAFLPLWTIWGADRRWWPLAVAGILLACAGHRALCGLAGAAFFGWLVFGGAVPWLKRHVQVKARIAIPTVLAVLAAAVFFAVKHNLPADLARFNWHNLRPGIWTFLVRPEIPTLLKIEVAAALALGAAGAAFPRAFGLRPAWVRLWLPCLLIPLVPFGSTEVMGMGERLTLTLPYMALCLLCQAVPRSVPASIRFRWTVNALTAGLVIAMGLFAGTYSEAVHPGRLSPDFALYNRVSTALAPHRPEMLIVHTGLSFYYQFATLGEAFSYEPEPHWPKDRIWRTAYGVTPAEWAYYLPSDCLWDSGLLYTLPGPYTLVREDVWHDFRARVMDLSGDEELKERVAQLWLNPSRRRPSFLYAKHRGERSDDPFAATAAD